MVDASHSIQLSKTAIISTRQPTFPMISWRVIGFQWVASSGWFKTQLVQTSSDKPERKNIQPRHHLAGSCSYCSLCAKALICGYFWLLEWQRIRNLCGSDISFGSRNCTLDYERNRNQNKKIRFSCCLFTKRTPNLLLKPYKANYFINGTGRIGEQRHTVLLPVITVCKRHRMFVQRRCNSWTFT